MRGGMARLVSSWLVLILAMSSMMMMAHLSAGQVAPAPAAACSSAIAQLLPCLTFLTNSSISTVGPGCCSGLTNVSTGSPSCLCQFISPSNANSSAQLGINDTRALQLPSLCGLSVSPASCAALLGPAAAPAPVAFAPVPAPITPAPVALVPAPGSSPAASVSPTPAAGTPSITPASSPGAVSPGPSSDCNSVTSSLLPCLDFLTGKDKSPPTDCCTQFGHVVHTSPACLCTLLSSSSSTITGVNVTLALELPTMCKVDAPLSDCTGVPPPGTSEGGPEAGPQPSAAKPSASGRRPFVVIALAVAVISYFCNELWV